tara:strand:- start:1483 stop:1704 length:222 start_codon:yes stop_codon:yes gene_type:complete
MAEQSVKNEKGDGKMRYKKYVELNVEYNEEGDLEKFFKWMEEAIVVWELDGKIKFEVRKVEQGVNNDNLRPPK